MEPRNCWEFWDCHQEVKEKCPAYLTGYGRDCYDFTEDDTPRVKRGFEHCSECPWYRKVKTNIKEKEK